MRALILVVVVGLFSGVAAAEKVRTNQSTKLFARPGEQAKVLMTVKAGQNMTVVEKEGRWLKVRVKGRTGYVPRSKVEMADDDGIARNTRRRPFVDGRSKKRGFGGSGGAPDDRVGADALGDGTGGRDEDDEEDEEDEDEPRPKKAVARPAPKKPAVTDDEDDDDEDDRPAPTKTVAKATSKAAPKPAAKRAQDDEEEEEDDDEGDASRGDDDDDDDDTGGGAKRAGSDDDDEDPIAEAPAPRRPTARVTKKVAVYAEPNASEDDGEEFFVLPTDVLYPMETRDGWTEIENEEGDYGWVRSDELELVQQGGGTSGRRMIDVRARLGLTYIQQGMRTAGSSVLTVPDNYNIGTSAVTLSLGGGILIPRGKLLFGGEIAYDFSKTLLGGVAYDPDGPDPMPSVNIGITLHNLNVRLLGGIDLKKKSGMTVLARLGYRYQGFLIANVESMTANPARLPSEVVTAPTLGAALVIPRLTDKIGLRVALDSIVFGGGITQTEGLEDGASPSLFALSLGTSLTYKLKKTFDLMATYDLNYMAVDFGAPLASSMRGHMGTQVTRTDIFHAVTFGIAKPF